jgi:NADH-quinone oxidoreductase subunit I
MDIFKGMLITLKHFFKKKVTIQYPEQNSRLAQFSVAFRF